MEGLDHYNAENYWSLFWYDPAVTPVPIEQQAAWHYFPDHDVVYWRSDWTPQATAFVFKCGPPEGHHAKSMYATYRDAVASNGHAHPDANGFILYGGGSYLTGPFGYAGIPMTANNNTLLIDGKRQAREGNGHGPFDGVPDERLDAIRIEEVKIDAGQVYVRGNATSAYEPELGLTKFVREFTLSPAKPNEVVITDDVAAQRSSQWAVLLHADEKVSGGGPFVIGGPASRLNIDIATPESPKTAIVPNIVASPGPPGSIDQGPKEQRGERLEISPAVAGTQARFVTKLTIVPKPRLPCDDCSFSV